VSANVAHQHKSSAVIAANRHGGGMITAELVAEEMHVMVRGDVRALCRVVENLQRAQESAARIYGLSARRVRAYWGREVKCVPAHEADSIRAARLHVARLLQQRLNSELADFQSQLVDLEQT
jgi:hypothetical protein